MTKETITVDNFSFDIARDISTDPLSALEVWVSFIGEPCCDDNGHQYRLYLPIGIKQKTLQDICYAFTRAVHCEHFSVAA